jgi:UDP-MurNAc hydroxylase
MTTIEHLGHSGLAVRHDGKLLLCDPWLAPTGAYNASWFPYPEYPHRDLAELLHPDAVYISHEHLDHFDPWFLAQLDKSTPIVTGRFHKRRCLKLLENLDFDDVRTFDDFEAFEISDDFIVRIAVPSYNCPPHWFDSCALIHAGDRTIFNLNDANLALELDEIRDNGVDVFLGQASPAIWYPLTYTSYDPAEKKRLMAIRRESAIESFMTGAKAVRPSLAIPFAGPPCFFDEELADFFLSEDSMFPTPTVAAERLRETTDIATEVLKPGDILHVNGSFKVERTPTYANFEYERDRRAYYEERKEEKLSIVRQVLDDVPPADDQLFDKFSRHMTSLIEGNPFFRARINIRVLFRVVGENGGDWVIDFRDEPMDRIVYAWSGETCPYQFEFQAAHLAQVLRNELSWEDLLLSLRFKAHRDPDKYNQYLFTFLKMADHGALQAIAQAELTSGERPDDTFIREIDGERWEIQRFCPHAGSDLGEAEVIDGKIVCPGHHWHFDLATGVCAESDYRLFCELADESDSD